MVFLILFFGFFADARELPYGSGGDGIWVTNPNGVFWENDEHHGDLNEKKEKRRKGFERGERGNF